MDRTNLDLSDEALTELLSVDPAVWKREARLAAIDIAALGPRVPPAL